jgi:hypothetical protein
MSRCLKAGQLHALAAHVVDPQFMEERVLAAHTYINPPELVRRLFAAMTIAEQDDQWDDLNVLEDAVRAVSSRWSRDNWVVMTRSSRYRRARPDVV